MSTRRWAGAGLGLLMGCFAAAGGCGGDDSAPSNDGGPAGDSPGACSTVAIVSGCKTVEQNGQTFELGCSSIESKTINGRVVCAVSGQCAMTPQGPCLDPMNVRSCLQNCRPTQDGGRDAASTPLGTTCASNADCGGGFTCLKPTDNIAPGAGPPNGLCTADCSISANVTLCKSVGGICVALTASPTAKSFCMEPCTTGVPIDPDSKCHGRLDSVCSPLDSPGSFACVPLCATDADCGTRKCDLGSGLCTDVVTPGAPIGSPCTLDPDCAGAICYPFDISPDASSSAGVCSALCRLGNPESCNFRTSPLDAGPPVGACLLSSSTNDIGDIGICAQLCDTVNDCGTNDPRWNCNPDSDVRTAFGHAGYCWLGVRPDGGTRADASSDIARDTGAPEAGPPEAGAPEAGPPEAGADVTPDASDDATPDNVDSDAIPPDGAPD
jgi:hypothetical protein